MVSTLHHKQACGSEVKYPNIQALTTSLAPLVTVKSQVETSVDWI